ncbi:PulJ/GspJ family protein [Roseateles sp. P5_E11]
MKSARRLHASGFGLLEAIVAMTIFAAVGTALYAWLGSNLRAVSGLNDARARAELTLQALELIDSVNPATERTGHKRWDQLELTWSSTEISPLRYSLSRGDASRWRVGLYRMQVQVRDVLSGMQADFEVTHTGQLSPESLPVDRGTP